MVDLQPKIIMVKSGSFALVGELNNQTVPKISLQLMTFITAFSGKELSLDLALVTRSDSAGVALLVEVMRRAQSAKLTLLFLNLPQQMQEIAGLSGMLDILPISKKEA